MQAMMSQLQGNPMASMRNMRNAVESLEDATGRCRFVCLAFFLLPLCFISNCFGNALLCARKTCILDLHARAAWLCRWWSCRRHPPESSLICGFICVAENPSIDRGC